MIAKPELQMCQIVLCHSASKEVSLLEEDFCRPGNSLIHLSFYNGDTVINFQLKYWEVVTEKEENVFES